MEEQDTREGLQIQITVYKVNNSQGYKDILYNTRNTANIL